MSNAIKFGLIFLGLAIGFGAWQYFKPAKNRAQDEALTAVTAQELFEVLSQLPSGETHPWVNETLLIEGEVITAAEATVLLGPGVACSMQPGNADQPPTVGEKVVIKGRVLGYDELFDEVQIDFGQKVWP